MVTVPDLASALLKALVRSKSTGAEAPSLHNRYGIVNVLGRGAFGVVVEARDEELDRMVAMKLSPTVVASEPMVAEARALAALKRHANVVQVFEVQTGPLTCGGMSVEVAYIAMELIEGNSLRAWSASAEPSEIVSAYAAVAEGLAFTHAQNVVHGDVKADNVVVRASGEPVLIDFGFSAPLSAEGRDCVVGTEDYMAPEVKRGTITPASDVYALAVSLSEALTGRLPERGRTEPSIPWSLRRPLHDATSTAASDRPSAKAFAEAIRQALKRARRVRALSYFAVVLALVAVAGLSYRAWLVNGAEDAYQRRVQAWNARDEASFGAAYADDFCYYNVANQTRSGLQESELRHHFTAGCKGRMQVDLTPRFVRPDEVVLEVDGDREGTYGTCSGQPDIHVLVRLQREDGVWQISGEGSQSHHGCWRSPPEFSLEE